MPQLELTSVVEHSLREHGYAVDRYLDKYHQTYLDMGREIQPDVAEWQQVWSRVAFAILSANAPFEDSVSALGYACRHKGQAEGTALAKYRMTPNKAEYLNAIPLGPEVCVYTRRPGESYHEQRIRLTEVPGLALTKASFLAALLDPLHADVACVDTHMQRVYLGRRGFQTLKLAEYLSVESRVREVGTRHGVSTFLAQWAIWDHARGKVQSHAVFPGGHK